jgi:hypothetical protein
VPTESDFWDLAQPLIEAGTWVLLEADVDVDAVGAQVHVVRAGQVPLPERVGRPGLGEPGDRRGRQAFGRAEKLPESRQVPRREPVQVQQRQYLVDAGRLARPRRQDGRGESLSFTGSGSIRLSLTRGATTDTEPALVSTSRGARVAVTHDQAMPVLVAFVGEAGDVGVDLGPQRLGQYQAGTLTHDPVDQRRRRPRGAQWGCHGRRNQRLR